MKFTDIFKEKKYDYPFWIQVNGDVSLTINQFSYLFFLKSFFNKVKQVQETIVP